MMRKLIFGLFVAAWATPAVAAPGLLYYPQSFPNLSGATAAIGGAALTVGACASGTVTINGATTGMALFVMPVTYPGAGFDWSHSYVSAANTVTVQVCADVAGTPTASVYNVRVVQ